MNDALRDYGLTWVPTNTGPSILIEMRLRAEDEIRKAHLPRILDERRVDLLASEWLRETLRWALTPRYDDETGRWDEWPMMPMYEP